MHLSFLSPIIPPGEVWGYLAKQVIKYSTVWENQLVKSPQFQLERMGI